MPRRRSVARLERIALMGVGHAFAEVAVATSDANNDSGQLSTAAAAKMLQEMLLESIPHYFHKEILSECLFALSELHRRTQDSHRLEDLRSLSCDLASRQKRLRRERRQLELLSTFFAHPAVREVDLSGGAQQQQIRRGLPRNLHWPVVARLCDTLPSLEWLQVLDLGAWSCKQFGLLSDHNQCEGWMLSLLPNLTRISVCNVGAKFFQSVGMHCPNVVELRVTSSDITDEVTGWVAKCPRLELVELHDNKLVTAVGYAQLLRASPKIRSLGRCDVLPQVLSTLYDPQSTYKRSVPEVPQLLSLESVIAEGKRFSPAQLSLLVDRCPFVTKARPTDEEEMVEDEGGDVDGGRGRHLCRLAELGALDSISIVASDFYGHLAFRLLEERGKGLTRIELSDVAEINLNALLLIGRSCRSLKHLSVKCCHFQIHPGDAESVDATCAAQNNGWFSRLSSLDLMVRSGTHLAILKVVVALASNVRLFALNSTVDLDEGIVRSVLQWNDLERLEEFEFSEGCGRVSLDLVNFVIQKCPNLRRISRLRSWGRVTRKQLDTVKMEVLLRNFDLVIDNGWNSIS